MDQSSKSFLIERRGFFKTNDDGRAVKLPFDEGFRAPWPSSLCERPTVFKRRLVLLARTVTKIRRTGEAGLRIEIVAQLEENGAGASWAPGLAQSQECSENEDLRSPPPESRKRMCRLVSVHRAGLDLPPSR